MHRAEVISGFLADKGTSWDAGFEEALSALEALPYNRRHFAEAAHVIREAQYLRVIAKDYNARGMAYAAGVAEDAAHWLTSPAASEVASLSPVEPSPVAETTKPKVDPNV